MYRLFLINFLIVFHLYSQDAFDAMEAGFIVKDNQKNSKTNTLVDGDIELTWQWSGTPQWLTPVWGVVFGNGFIGGSTVNENDYVPVKIEFSTDDTTFAQTYRRDLGYSAGGVGIFRGTAWDMSDEENPRRLNICLVEDNNEKDVNLLWDPNQSSNGSREYFLIMLSDYDGTGLTYNDENHGTGADKLYGGWFRLSDDRVLFESDPAEINISISHINNFYVIPEDGQNNLFWKFVDPGADELRLYSGDTSSPGALLATLPVSARTYSHDGLSNNSGNYYRIEVVSSSEVISVSKELHVRPFSTISQNMNVLDNLNLHYEYGDVWGYTDSVGTEYALICARWDGLSIVDITNSPPVEVGFVPSINPGYSDSKDVKVYKNYAYLINESDPIQIIDLSNPSSASTVGTIVLESGSGAHNCYVDNDYLFVIGNHGIGGLEIFDLTNPISPLKVGSFEPFYYHDVYVRNDTVYAAGIYGDGVDIIDISNKEEPDLLARFNYPNSGAHNVWTTEDGKYAFVGDEIGHAGNQTRVFNISDLEDITYVADIIVDSSAVAHNCYVKGDLLYIGHYTEGIRVFDISNPESPYEVAFYDTYLPEEYGFGGVWSVYPYFESGKIIVSDRQTGLWVMQLDDALTTIAEKTEIKLPLNAELYQNYPNPFNPSTQISFYLPKSGQVTLKIFDSLGKEVDHLISQNLSSGSHNFNWIANDIAAGVYFYQLKSNNFTLTKKLVLIK